MTTIRAHTQAEPSHPHPFADTKACVMLGSAIRRKVDSLGTSLRKIAEGMDMSSAQLSHMATGRVGIPIDTALRLASALDIDQAEFVAAVFQQRHPEAAQKIDLQAAVTKGEPNSQRWSFMAHASDDALSPDHVDVLQQVSDSRQPKARWASLPEAQLLQLVRRRWPNGITNADIAKIESAINSL